ncbi:MAG: bifunctional ornithine acetyltransferase/N-acetylglutamate synthase, partial [Roseimicrobium sp.]
MSKTPSPTDIPFKQISGGVTAPMGFRAGAISCGIKDPNATRLDLALIVSDLPATTAACFTTNRVKAACVRVSQQHV